MLKGIDPRLNADVLYALGAMGHGDHLVVTDTNFPAHAVASETVLGHLLTMENVSAPEALKAILSVMPLDTFVEDFAARMEVIGAPDRIEPVMAEAQAVVDADAGTSRPIPGVERFAFYDLSRAAFAVIQTGETRFYGNFMLRKGVIPPEG